MRSPVGQWRVAGVAQAVAVAAPAVRTRWLALVDPYRPIFELGAVAMTGALHLAWPATGLSRALLVVPLVAAWLAYVGVRAREDPGVVDRWGFGLKGLGPTAAVVTGLLGLALPAMALLGWVQGHELPPPTWLVAWAMYPIWGLVQQFMVQSLVTGNLSELPGRWGHPVLVTLVSATLFGAVHAFDPPLVPATFLLGLVLAPLWLKYRSVWPLAVAHGWLGTGMYFLVLGRDPLAGYLF